MTAAVHQDYVDGAPEAGRARLVWLLDRAAALVPGAEPVMSYGMPAFTHRKRFFYVGAFKRHLGVYPPVTDDTALVERLAPWRNPKGNLLLPYDQPFPEAELEATIVALAKQYAG